ncbi:MAG TPA: condensation domain-containing protein, partial [Clostridia bacterium]|nr:condensation domain-containing protein [Clostridia bacterium]
IYILGENNSLQPLNVPGELCIAGVGLARGYLNRPELTAEKFIEDPFVRGERLYKTGDLARWLTDGNIEFIGRIDHQVKVRGYRIELGEIESRLSEHKAVKEAIVAAREDGNNNKYLCAYLVAEKELSAGELREHLSRALPDYMIPSYFMQLDKLPLTPNGKTDRKALPEPDESIKTGAEYEAPRNETEEKLAELWGNILKTEKVGINDNFFELGGHSLKATSLAGRIHKELGVEVPLRAIFKMPTIKGLAEYIKTSGSNRFAAIPLAKEAEYYELSPAQNRLYTLQLMDKDSIAYNISGFLEISGEIDKNKLESAFRELIKRHEALRTSFELLENGPKQKIHKEVDFTVQYEEAKEEEIEEILKNLIKPFDLTKAPLFRAGLVKMKTEHDPEEKYILVYDLHHIISDGVSSAILAEEFIKLYEGKELPELGIQYKDYAQWQLGKLESRELSKYEEYWLQEYQGEVPVLNLPADYPRPGIQSYEGDIYTFKLEEELLARLKAFAAETGATLFMVLLEILSVVLSRYSGQEDMVIGTVSAGRLNEGTERLIGLFLNNIALRCLPKKEKTAISYLRELKESVICAYENQSYPIEELIGKLKLKKDMSRNALFDVMLILQNFERGSSQIASESFSMKPYHWVKKVSDYDMSVYAEENGKELVVNVQYCTRLFKEKTIEGFGKHFCKIAAEIAAAPEQRLIDIPMLEEQEAEKVIYGFNNKNMVYEKDKTLHRLFEEQVERTPGNIAAVYGEKQLSYRELNIKANKLAGYIKRYCTEENFVVGIMTEKSLEMLVAILAVLKAGGAYLPIDPSYPQERIGYMLEDSRVRLLMVQERLKAKLETAVEKIVLEDEASYQGDGENCGKTASSSDLAYIIYTSGTTGKPKGIMTEHRNVIAYVSSFNDMFKLTEKDVTLQQASITFDGFVEETYSMLTCGGKVVIPGDEQVKEAKELKAVIDKNRVTILSCSPLILSEFNKLEPMESVHTFLSSSDILK